MMRLPAHTLPPDWEKRSFSQRLAHVASFVCGAASQPPDSHREWMRQIATDVTRLHALHLVAYEFGYRDGAELTPEVDIALSESAVRMHTYDRWLGYGCQTFVLSESLTALLCLTEAHDVYSAETIQFPYPAFLIEIPAGYIPQSGENERPVRLLVHRYRRAQYHGTPEDTDPEQDWLRVEIFLDDAISANATINKRMDELDVELSNYIHELLDGQRFVRRTDSGQLRTYNCVLNLICNMALWLQASGGMQPASGRSKSIRQQESSPWPTTWILGREVKLDRNARRLAREVTQDPDTRPADWKLRSQKLVRGYWKHQPYGPAGALRKLIHVAPYLRGPKGEEAWSSLYRLSDDREG